MICIQNNLLLSTIKQKQCGAMKQLIILVIGVVNMVYSQSEKKEAPDRFFEFEIVNSNDELITEATITINGYEAVYQPGKKKYEIKYKDARLYHIIIKHTEYENIDIDNQTTFSNKFYLLKTGQPYFFRNGLLYPVRDNSDLLYVTRNSRKTPEEDSLIQGDFFKLLEELNMEVVFAMDSFLNVHDKPLHISPSDHLRTSYIIRKKNGNLQMKGNHCVELENLREADSLVKIAGPLISNREDFSDASTCTGEISILKNGTDLEEFLVKLKELGLKTFKHSVSAGTMNIYCNMPSLLLTSVNELMQSIYELEDVQIASANGLSFTFPLTD